MSFSICYEVGLPARWDSGFSGDHQQNHQCYGFLVVIMLLMYSVLHCLYSVGNKITTTTRLPEFNVDLYMEDPQIQNWWVNEHSDKDCIYYKMRYICKISKSKLSRNLLYNRTCPMKAWESYYAFQHLPGIGFTNSILLTLSWKTISFERPHNSVVTLYKYHCICRL